MPGETWTIEKPVGRVRWIDRHIGGGGEKVLQQYWSITTMRRVIDVEECLGVHGEWRDVPTEIE